MQLFGVYGYIETQSVIFKNEEPSAEIRVGKSKLRAWLWLSSKSNQFGSSWNAWEYEFKFGSVEGLRYVKFTGFKSCSFCSDLSAAASKCAGTLFGCWGTSYIEKDIKCLLSFCCICLFMIGTPSTVFILYIYFAYLVLPLTIDVFNFFYYS